MAGLSPASESSSIRPWWCGFSSELLTSASLPLLRDAEALPPSERGGGEPVRDVRTSAASILASMPPISPEWAERRGRGGGEATAGEEEEEWLKWVMAIPARVVVGGAAAAGAEAEAEARSATGGGWTKGARTPAPGKPTGFPGAGIASIWGGGGTGGGTGGAAPAPAPAPAGADRGEEGKLTVAGCWDALGRRGFAEGEEEVAGADTTLEVADDRCMVPSLELPQSMNSRTMGGRGGVPPPPPFGAAPWRTPAPARGLAAGPGGTKTCVMPFPGAPVHTGWKRLVGGGGYMARAAPETAGADWADRTDLTEMPPADETEAPDDRAGGVGAL